MSSISDSDTSVMAIQNQNVRIIGNCCNPIVIDQTAQLKVISNESMTDEFLTNFSATLKTNLLNQFDQNASKIKNALGDARGGTMVATLKNAITKVMSRESFKNSVKFNMDKTFAKQSQDVNIICGDTIPQPSPPEYSGIPDTGCYIGQNFLLEQVTNNVMEGVFKDVSEDPDVKSMMDELQADELRMKKGDEYGIERRSWFSEKRQWIMILLVVIFVPLMLKFLKKLIF